MSRAADLDGGESSGATHAVVSVHRQVPSADCSVSPASLASPCDRDVTGLPTDGRADGKDSLLVAPPMVFAPPSVTDDTRGSHARTRDHPGGLEKSSSLVFSGDEEEIEEDVPLAEVEKEKWLIWKVDQIIRVKVYFLAFHYAWIVGVSLIGGLCIYLLERNNPDPAARTDNFLDAWYNMASGVTCTGLFTRFTTGYGNASIVIWHIGVICGGTVFTSVVPSLLRIATLKLLYKLEKINGKLTPLRAEHIRKLTVTSWIMAIATLSYFFFFHVLGTILYSVHFPVGIALARTIATFNNSGFLLNPPDGFNTHFVNLAVLVILIPAGSTLFPVGLRAWVHLMRFITIGFLYVKKRFALAQEAKERGRRRADTVNASSRRSIRDEEDASLATNNGGGYGGERDSLIHHRQESTDSAMLQRESTMLQNDSMLSTPDNMSMFALATDHTAKNKAWEWTMRHEYVRGFRFILQSSKPVNHHPWLFRPTDTLYIVIAWCFVVIFQTVPYFFQQWEGRDAVLAPQPDGFMKVALAFTQTVCNRFSGIGLFDLNKLSDGQICTILFALYLPPLPIPTERTRRKWKQMFAGGFYRLLGSRFWWLFTAVFLIVFIEEGSKYDVPKRYEYGWNHGILIRVLFEVLSAYATSGLSLQLPGSVSSLSSSFDWPSKVIIMLCMFTGRHRAMDLGLDIGLTDMEKQAELDPAAAERNRFADFDMASLRDRKAALRDAMASPDGSVRIRRRLSHDIRSPTLPTQPPLFEASTRSTAQR